MQVLRDISHGGLAFVSGERFAPGDVVELDFPSLPRDERITGEIMWCGQIEAGQPEGYAAGLRFLDEDARFSARLVEQICHIERYREEQCRAGRSLDSRQAATEWITRFASRFPR